MGGTGWCCSAKIGLVPDGPDPLDAGEEPWRFLRWVCHSFGRGESVHRAMACWQGPATRDWSSDGR